jgi:hypothetical protein
MSTFLDTSVITFYVSFLGIVGMIYLKYLELNKNKRYFISKLSERADRTIVLVYNNIRKIILSINKDNAIALIQWIAYYILSWARDTYIWLYRKARSHPPSKMVVDMVRGRGEVKRNGGVSFYLRRIAQKDEDSVK